MKYLLSYLISPTELEKRNYGLDVMRGIGLLMVLIGHSLHFYDPFFPKIHRASHFLLNGVELFFSLSGFLIGRIIIQLFIKEDSYKLSSLLVFLKRRWYKTLPVYYLAIIINLTFAYFVTGFHKDFNWKYLVFIHSFFKSDSWFFPVSYSLAIEEWFYLIFPILFIIAVVAFRNRFNPYWVLIFLCSFYIFFSLIIRTYMHNCCHPHWDSVMRKSLVTRLDCSVYGVLIAIIYHLKEYSLKKFKNLLFVTGIMIYGVCTYFRIVHPEGFFYNVMYFTAIPLCFAISIPFFYYLKTTSNFLISLFTYLSIISFAFYLFHLSPLMDIFVKICKENSLGFTNSVYFLYLFTTFFIVTIWYKKVEKPLTDLREK